MTDEDKHILRGPPVTGPVPSESLGQYLLERARVFGNELAQIETGRDVRRTFAQLRQDALALAGGLQSLGLAPGDVVMVVCGNRADFMVVMLGVLYAGGVVAPVSPQLDQGDMRHLLSLLEPKIVFCEPSCDALPCLLDCPHLVLFESPEFDALLRSGPGECVNRTGSDLALVVCSSGTTGRMKGVAMSQYSLHWSLLSFRKQDGGFWHSPVRLNLSGPYWISGLFTQMMGLDGGQLVVMMPSFTPERFLQTVEKHKVQAVVLGPSQLVKLALYKGQQHDTSSLQHVMYGGAAMSLEMHRLAEKRLGICIVQVYGMTEILFIATNIHTCYETDKATVGLVYAGIEAKVVDLDTGKALAANQEGELWFRGPTVMQGYYRNPEATAETVDSEGWVHSGDVGYYDKNGCLFVIDRIKSLIKYCGQYVPPAEIEGTLLLHPAVQEAAVVGVHHDTDQERAVGCVVLRPGASASPEELVQYVAGKLSVMKQLHGGVVLVDSLPKTATGKVKRRDLRNIVQQSMAPWTVET